MWRAGAASTYRGVTYRIPRRGGSPPASLASGRGAWPPTAPHWHTREAPAVPVCARLRPSPSFAVHRAAGRGRPLCNATVMGHPLHRTVHFPVPLCFPTISTQCFLSAECWDHYCFSLLGSTWHPIFAVPHCRASAGLLDFSAPRRPRRPHPRPALCWAAQVLPAVRAGPFFPPALAQG